MSDEQPRIERIRTDDGVSIAIHRLGSADGQPVLLAPGTFSNWTFWLGTRGIGYARDLARNGFDVHVIDFRGHGHSQRPAPGEDWIFDDWGRLDLAAAVRAIAARAGKLFVVGHSAGGASLLATLAADADVREVVRGAVVLATPLPWLQRWRRAAAWGIRFAARRLPAFPAKLLKLGPEDEISGVMAQWMDWNLAGHWTGRDGTDYAAALGEVRTPLLFLAGAADRRFAPPYACEGLFDLIGSPDRLFVLAGTDTGFSRDFGHVDLVVSPEARREIWPIITDWISARTNL